MAVGNIMVDFFTIIFNDSQGHNPALFKNYFRKNLFNVFSRLLEVFENIFHPEFLGTFFSRTFAGLIEDFFVMFFKDHLLLKDCLIVVKPFDRDFFQGLKCGIFF